MNASGFVARLAGILVLVAPQAQSQVTSLEPSRKWSFSEYRGDGSERTLLQVPEDGQDPPVGGELYVTYDFGPAHHVFLPPFDDIARGEIYSSASGVTYFVQAESPAGNSGIPDHPIGGRSNLEQYQRFRKDSADAKLEFVVTGGLIQTEDNNLIGRPSAPDCPATDGKCLGTMEGEIQLSVKAYTDAGPTFFHASGGARVNGYHGKWFRQAWSDGFASSPLWNSANFDWNRNLYHDSGTSAILILIGPLRRRVDLSTIGLGEEFTLRVDAVARSYDRRGAGEGSGVRAFLQDPLNTGGVQLRTTGLTPLPNPLIQTPAPEPLAPVPCETGIPDPAAGKLQFDAARFEIGEWAGAGPQIAVTRTGGSTGAVSATFTTADGTATALADYTPLSATIRFEDGDTSTRAVTLPIVHDLSAEPDKTVNLTLSAPGGCASLGPRATAVLTIVDDDRPVVPPATFTIGGTVTGLAGSGLALDNLGAVVEPAADGPFTFPGTVANGVPYEVVVATQPVDPAQVCSVTNGSGTVAGANVTDIAVLCVTPPPPGELDPGFGAGGKVTTASLSEAEASLVQPDGKIVIAGNNVLDFRLARFNADGTPDAGFGTAGIATTSFGAIDEAFDLALQPDGKIVAVGRVNGGANYDFGVARYNPDGSPDVSFGGGDGTVTTDFGGADYAHGVVIQPDGKIVVAGQASNGVGFPLDNDFALARYNPDGTPDTGFGTAGTVLTNIGGNTDLGQDVALQPDGRIVVAGRVAFGGGFSYDFAVVRYNADGSPDAGFGAGGTVTTDLGNDDSGYGVAVAPDGKIVVAGHSARNGSYDVALVRYEADGTPDVGFGGQGMVTVDFASAAGNDFGEDLVLQPDGRIVVVGRVASTTIHDLALARFEADGSLDTSFAADGWLTIDFFGSGDFGQAVALQADGKIVATGYSANGFTTNAVLVRVNP